MSRATLAFFVLGILGSGVYGQEEGSEHKDFRLLVEEYEKEKGLSVDKRLDTIEAFKNHHLPECVEFLTGVLPEEENPAVIRAITVDLAFLNTCESVRAAVRLGLPRLKNLIAVSSRLDPLVPRPWSYKKDGRYRYLPGYYFGEIAEALRQVKDQGAQRWLFRHGLEGPIREDPLLTQFIISVIGKIEHEGRVKTFRTVIRKVRDPQVIGAVFECARQAGIKESAFLRDAKRFLRYRNFHVQQAALKYLLELAPSELKGELPGLLRSKSYKTRILAVDAVIQCGLPIRTLLPLLDDPDWRVRVSVFRCLGVSGSAEAVRPLIQRLGKEEHPRARDDLIDTLIRLTGVSVGRQYPAWEGWWKSHKGEAEIKWRSAEDLGSIKSERAESTRTISYYGLAVVSNNTSFIMDVSGSMREEYEVEVEKDGGSGRTRVGEKETRTVRRRKIDYARENLKKVLKQVPSKVNVNILVFSQTVKPWKQHLVKNTVGNRADAYQFLDKQEPAGSTNIFGTLVLALKDEKVDTVFLLSDGAPTSGRVVDPERILTEVRQINLFRKVKINTIGFNLKGKARKLMVELADQNYGAFVAK